MATSGGNPASLWERVGGAAATADSLSVRPIGRDTLDTARVRRRLAPCPEIDCLRAILPPGLLAAAELRAAEIGVGADRVLVTANAISDEDYARAFAQSLGMDFETLDEMERFDCPLDDKRLVQALTTGKVPLRLQGRDVIVMAPEGVEARRLWNAVSSDPLLAQSVRVTTRARLKTFVERSCRGALNYQAAYALRSRQPDFSAGTRGSRRALFAAVLALSFAASAEPKLFYVCAEVVLALIFLGWTALRLLGLATHRPQPQREFTLHDDQLPVYTIAVALYRERAAVPGLVRALSALNYPVEKLDIKLIVEADDHETTKAIDALSLHAPFEVISCPNIGPRTKPKALNVALPYARGRFVAVYDAEDRPEPNQLRRALQGFLRSNPEVACVQARLTIDNTDDSWLTRLFTAEYAGLFDVFLPGVAEWQFPLPLGGSSNHFRADVLRQVGAWDPFNVTEDADLGMRLARFGCQTIMIDSATYEEAPSRLVPWLRQRTRWFKGWIQTWLVHMRHPVSLARDLSLSGFAVFQLVVGGSVLAALVHSIFAGALLWRILFQASTTFDEQPIDVALAGLHGMTLVAGYLISGLLGFVGLWRRGLVRCGWSLLLMPAYWILLSIAAWRALLQLIVDPYRWEKTEHGLARTSRLTDPAPRA